MQRFSNIQKINKKNLSKVPSDKPGVFRIIDAEGEIMYIGKARGGRLNERIELHKGRFMKGLQFQYRTTESKEDVDQLQREEIRKNILSDSKRRQSDSTSAN